MKTKLTKGQKALRKYGMTAETHRALTRYPAPDHDLQALEYALWLAKRDGIAIPADWRHSIYWSFVTVDGRQAKRCYHVQFSPPLRHWNGRVLAYEYDTTTEPITILIPNWDFVPAPAIEEIDEPMLLAA